VQGKRAGSKPLDVASRESSFKGWHERGYLPHRDESGLVQFVTFHLADAFPAVLRAEWGHLAAIEDDQKRRAQIEAYLDKGRGEGLLSRPAIARLVEEAIRFNHGKTYELRAWVLMANHVHVLFKTLDKPMGRIVGTWKDYTAKEANRLLGRSGTFWARDYWDTYMRDEAHAQRAQKYIENNPAKARLVLDPKQWQWSSAGWRDEYGRLKL
jgi:REP element-mobilizing transposase RayT